MSMCNILLLIKDRIDTAMTFRGMYRWDIYNENDIPAKNDKIDDTVFVNRRETIRDARDLNYDRSG